MAGVNRFEPSIYENVERNKKMPLSILNESFSASKNPCIFLSHKNEDKEMVVELGEYIKSYDIDIYLDANDIVLQNAVKRKDAKLITLLIEFAIRKTTHLMSTITEHTKDSWWVPYEIGSAKSYGKDVSSCIFKNVNKLPEFIECSRIINDINGLDGYLTEIRSSTKHTTDDIFNFHLSDRRSSSKLQSMLYKR